MSVLDKQGYLLQNKLIDTNTNDQLKKEFNYLVNNLTLSRREAIPNIISNKGFQYQIADAGASFLTVNLYEVSIMIRNIIMQNSKLQLSDLQLSQIFGEYLLEPNRLFWHNDCIDYNSNHYRAILYCDVIEAKNGPLEVWPGSHYWASIDTVPHKILPTLIKEVNSKSKKILAQPGDILIFDSKLIHSRASNLSKRPNRTITFEFFAKKHIKRIFSFSIPSIHLTTKVIDNIDMFSTPMHINSVNPNDLVANKLWSAEDAISTLGINSIKLTSKSIFVLSNILVKWMFIQIRNNLLAMALRFKKRIKIRFRTRPR